MRRETSRIVHLWGGVIGRTLCGVEANRINGVRIVLVRDFDLRGRDRRCKRCDTIRAKRAEIREA
jgi:hypothetical protein